MSKRPPQHPPRRKKTRVISDRGRGGGVADRARGRARRRRRDGVLALAPSGIAVPIGFYSVGSGAVASARFTRPVHLRAGDEMTYQVRLDGEGMVIESVWVLRA